MSIKIAILGLGTVGYGVYDILQKVPELSDIKVVKIFDKDFSKQAIVNNLITDNYKEILDDKSIKIVVETMGAGEFSYLCIKQALMASKHVVTANKEVIANYIDELSKIKLLNNVSLCYEASVGGGIPIIKQIQNIACVNEISEIKGILNGTTNYILSKMTNDNLTFREALNLAQQAGFAEADPTADLEGLDMVRKIAILSDIGYKTNVNINDIWNFGIKNISDKDIAYANKLNCCVKFIASSRLENNQIYINVEPKFVPKDNVFAMVSNEFNIVTIKSNYNDELMFVGKGAGRYPTANAIVNDIITIAHNDFNYTFCNLNDYLITNKDKGTYYLRVKDVSKINKDLIKDVSDNQIITKDIDFNIIKENIENIIIYAKVEK